MKKDVNFLWNRFSMREALLLGFCATFIVVTKATLRMKLGISGHAMFFLIFFLLLARGIVPKTGSATLVGLLAGALSIAMGLAHKGPIIMLNFALPAFVIDAAGIFLPRFATGFLTCLFIGGIAAGTKGITEGLSFIIHRRLDRDNSPESSSSREHGLSLFGMLGALPVPAIIRKLRTNRLIPDPGNGKGRSKPAR